VFVWAADIVVSGQKYYFKAGSDMERENWIEQLQDASRITVTTTHYCYFHCWLLEVSAEDSVSK